ncbi:hypothetical protein ACHAWX_004098 [Stephanocyclus meneghinianus]
MIPTMPAQLSSSAKETTESVSKAFKSLYSNALQCTPDMSLASLTSQLPSECHSGKRDAEGAVTLDWRADPMTSMSDLTLVVYDGSGGVPYYVHTLLLAFGGRRSGFVAEQLKQQQKKGAATTKDKEYKIEIYVPPLAARYMPTFLDYIYGATLQLSTSSAPSLRYLSNRFDVRELHTHITKSFLSQDLELATAPQYCTAADELKDYELRDKALRVMAERMERMNATHLREMSPRLMRSLVQCDQVDCGGVILSEKVAQWLRCRDGTGPNAETRQQGDNCRNTQNSNNTDQIIPLSDEDFYWITHVQHMPQISQREALFYLDFGAKYPSVMNEVGPGSLKHRCLAACSGSWAIDYLAAHLENPDEVKMDLYQNLDDRLKVQLLESAVVSAKMMEEDKKRQCSQREVTERDVARSEEIMYENLHREEECPSITKFNKVVVMGCGIPSANGVYISDCNASSTLSPRSTTNKNQDANNITYEKEAVWNGSRVTFILAPQKSGHYYSHYKLAVRQNYQTKVLYTSPTLTRGSRSGGTKQGKMPEYGWEVEGDEEGIHPPPLFVGTIAGDIEE